ncbi:hypothetical protein GGR57DRAFT_471089 [Xylariaceae sp. FL1272]|nr:hypothetical protein GGR57DRAFT_471089 [Xylariaceae sp. FL1272]
MLQFYEGDRRSVYIGNLPANVDNLDEVTRNVESTYGRHIIYQVISSASMAEGTCHGPIDDSM